MRALKQAWLALWTATAFDMNDIAADVQQRVEQGREVEIEGVLEKACEVNEIRAQLP